MAKSLEEHLYRSAGTKDEYLDMATLRTRLQKIAQSLEMHRSKSTGNMSQGSQNSEGSGSRGMSFLSQQGTVDHSNTATVSLQQGNSQVIGVQAGNTQTNQHYQMPNNGSVGNMQIQGQQRNAAWSSGLVGMNANPNGAQTMNQHQFAASASVPQQQQQTSVTANQGIMSKFNNLAALQRMGQNANVSSLAASLQQAQMDQQQMPMLSQQQQGGVTPALSNSGANALNDSRFQDPNSVQKRRVILQQQQRLLLLRHASKCTAGPSCPTKFCAQMVTLWRHMKTCRDRNCRTSHCLSSRCVLNHYRICKSNGKTASCEVCGPVMSKIKQLERDDGSVDPLTRDHQDPGLQSANLSTVSSPNVTSVTAPVASSEQTQLQQLQSQQMKLQARLESLQKLQKQQNQLLEQQRQLQELAQTIKDPNSQRAQQLQQQQMLLSQLQKRCQQQQLLLQHELQEQTAAVATGGAQSLQQQLQLQQQNIALSNTQTQSIFQQSEHGTSTSMDKNESGPTLANESQFPQIDAAPIEGKKRRSIKTTKVRPSRRGSGKGTKGLREVAAAHSDAANPPSKKRNSIPGQTGLQKKAKSMDSQLHDEKSPGKHGTPRAPARDTSLMTSMTKEDIAQHLKSLNKKIWLSSRTVTHKCLPIIQDLIDDQFGWVFHDAVDPVALGLPDYFDIVKNPMHLELVKKKLENAIYADMDSFERDVRLVFENAILYNGDDSEVGRLAQDMLSKFEALYNAVVEGKQS